MAPYYCFQMEMDPGVEDHNLEDPAVLQVRADKAPDLGVLMGHLITDLHLVEMDHHLMTISKDLHLEEVGEVLVTEEVLVAVEVLATVEVAEVLATVEVAEVFATVLEVNLRTIHLI